MLCGSHRMLAFDVDLDVRETNTALELLRCQSQSVDTGQKDFKL